jgi:WD40 repeat protein/serine/threonine protein kinase
VESVHAIKCACGHRMRVRETHLGRVFRCSRCEEPVLVNPWAVSPPMDFQNGGGPRHFSADEVPLQLNEGDRFLEQYEVLGLLGKGGMGEVHRIYHKGWGIDLAIKTLKKELVDREHCVDFFEKECETWVSLDSHPHVVKCFYVRRLGGSPRIFMEFVHGGALSKWVRTKRLYGHEPEVNLARILDIAIQMAWGLEYAHKQGLVHQDVKPSNVMVTRDGLAKLTDFGLVRALAAMGEDSDPDEINPALGTPPYSSPEQGVLSSVSPRCDMWSWAATIVEVLLGRLQWDNGLALINAFDDYRCARSEHAAIPSISEPFGDVLGQCLKEAPEDRPGSMGDVVEALKSAYFDMVGKEYGRQSPDAFVATADTLNNRAVSLMDLGKSDEAEELWSKALAIDCDHVEANYNRLLHLWHRGRIADTALFRFLQGLCQTSPDTWLPRYLLGRALLERGDAKTALKTLRFIEKDETHSREVMYAVATARDHLFDSRRMLREFHGHAESVSSVALSSDGWLAASGDERGCLRLWEVSTRDCIAEWEAHKGCVRSVCIGVDDALVLTGGDDGRMKLWDRRTCERKRTFRGHKDAVRSVQLSEDGTLAISGSRDHAIRVWDTDSGTCLKVLEGHDAGVNSVELSRCGGFALSGGRDQTVKYWDLRDGVCVRTLKGHRQRVHSVSLSGDGTLAVSGGRDAVVNLWDLATGTCLRALHGHHTEAFSVCLSDNGRYILSASRGGTMKLWDRARGQCIRTFTGGAPMCLSRDGRFALSGDRRGVLKFWSVACHRPNAIAPYMICRELD